MRFWRMSFRAGNQGPKMWPQCQRWGVAAITYDPLIKTDLSKHPKGEPKELWKRLKSSQKASLSRVAYEMTAGDVIYVKEGPNIIDRGVVTGGYRFDSEFHVVDPNGVPWAHQVPVDWSRDFPTIKILLGAEQFTVKELSVRKVEEIDTKAEEGTTDKSTRTAEANLPRSGLLAEDAYYRESAARLKTIIPLHNKLSNRFCGWLEHEHQAKPVQEREQVDIRFDLHNVRVLAELKICYGVDTTKSIREALGQLLEYNHYPTRSAADEWLIVLDKEPTDADKQFIDSLRKERALPLTLGWQKRLGFDFHPKWPV